MHDEIGTQGPQRPYSHDPLRRPPRPGSWVLWHGEHARALLEVARQKGQPVDGVPRSAPPLPPSFPVPSPSCAGRWVVESSGQRFYVQHDEHDNYVSTYVCNLTQAAPESL